MRPRPAVQSGPKVLSYIILIPCNTHESQPGWRSLPSIFFHSLSPPAFIFFFSSWSQTCVPASCAHVCHCPASSCPAQFLPADFILMRSMPTATCPSKSVIISIPFDHHTGSNLQVWKGQPLGLYHQWKSKAGISHESAFHSRFVSACWCVHALSWVYHVSYSSVGHSYPISFNVGTHQIESVSARPFIFFK